MASTPSTPFNARSPLEPISPGPMNMSDLDPSVSMPPRRLKPISPQQKKKRKRRKVPITSNSHPDVVPPPTLANDPPALMNQDMLSQLRARLEQPDESQPEPPDHHPVAPPTPTSSLVIENSGATPPLPETTPSPPELPLDIRTPGVGEEGAVSVEERRSVDDRKHRRRRQKRPKMEATGSAPLQPASPHVAVEMSEHHDENPLPTPQVVVQSPSQEQVPSPDVSVGVASGRQLPDFPMGPEASTEFPRLSVAMQPHIQASFHADGPMELISEEDLVERVEEDKSVLAGPHYTLPSSKPNPFISQSKEIIFVERKDGRGFVSRRRDEEPVRADIETSSGLDREVTGIHIALQVHLFLQRLAFIAHGLIAGLSLWDCLVLNLLSRQSGRHLNLLEHYHPLTLPSHALHFLLLSLVLLSLIDRFDFARSDKKCLQDFVRSPSQIFLLAVLFCVCLALVVTLSMASIDERIALLTRKPILWDDILTIVNLTDRTRPPLPPSLFRVPSSTYINILYVPRGTDSTSDRLTPFLALTILRALCCGLSWLTVVWITTYDRLQGYLNGIVETVNKNLGKQ